MREKQAAKQLGKGPGDGVNGKKRFGFDPRFVIITNNG